MVDITGELLIALSSIVCTGVGSILLLIYRVKCSEMTMCCLKCKRDMQGENEADQIEHALEEDTIPLPSLPNSRRSSINTT
jgi:hypothetical protein